MNPRKLLVPCFTIVCGVLAACAPGISAPTVTPYQATATAEAATWPVTLVWQVQGRGADNPDGFGRPVDLAVDSQSNLYVVDTASHRIQKFDTDGKLLTMWGSKGNGEGQFMFAMPKGHFGAVAVGAGDIIYVGDYNSRVQKFDSSGKFLSQWGAPGTGDGQFSGFMALAADAQGNVYVSDGGNFRVQKFDSNGKFIRKWGSRGSGDGQFGTADPESGGPAGMAVDRNGNVYVDDPDNHRVEKFDTNGKYLTAWGSAGNANGQFVTNLGIAIDPQGNVFVTDNGTDTVSRFDSSGKLLFRWGKPGEEPGQFNYPGGIAIDQKGYIYVANVVENIEKFAPK